MPGSSCAQMEPFYQALREGRLCLPVCTPSAWHRLRGPCSSAEWVGPVAISHVRCPQEFLPMAVKLFAQQRSLQFIFWAEDDCGFCNQSNAKSVLEAAHAISPSAGWLGYVRVNGEPRYQSHLVSFTRWSATAMLHDLNELWSGHATPADFYMGLDTYIWELCGRSDIIRPSPQSLVHQIRSLTSGRH